MQDSPSSKFGVVSHLCGPSSSAHLCILFHLFCPVIAICYRWLCCHNSSAFFFLLPRSSYMLDIPNPMHHVRRLFSNCTSVFYAYSSRISSLSTYNRSPCDFPRIYGRLLGVHNSLQYENSPSI